MVSAQLISFRNANSLATVGSFAAPYSGASVPLLGVSFKVNYFMELLKFSKFQKVYFQNAPLPKKQSSWDKICSEGI